MQSKRFFPEPNHSLLQTSLKYYRCARGRFVFKQSKLLPNKRFLKLNDLKITASIAYKYNCLKHEQHLIYKLQIKVNF